MATTTSKKTTSSETAAPQTKSSAEKAAKAAKLTTAPEENPAPKAVVKNAAKQSVEESKPAAEATPVKPEKKIAVKKSVKTVETTGAASSEPVVESIDTPVSGAAAEPQMVSTSGAKPEKWGEIRQLLLQMKEVTLQEISRSVKSGSETSVGEEPTGDIYDQASIERDRELGLILSDRERERLHSIDDALLRIHEGDYGICEECDEEIPSGRLKVMPFTRHCVKCKSDLEKQQAQTRRFEEDRAYREIPIGDDDDA